MAGEQPLNSPIPRGIEVLVKKAAVDAAFRELLLANRAAAADEIGLTLDPAESAMLNAASAEQIESIIAQTHVDPAIRWAFLGKVAAAMLLALGAGYALVAPAVYSAGSRIDNPGHYRILSPATPETTAPANPATQPRPVPPPAGIRPDRPPPAPSPGVRPAPPEQPK